MIFSRDLIHLLQHLKTKQKNRFNPDSDFIKTISSVQECPGIETSTVEMYQSRGSRPDVFY